MSDTSFDDYAPAKPLLRGFGHTQEKRNQYGTPGGPFSQHTEHMESGEANRRVRDDMTKMIVTNGGGIVSNDGIPSQAQGWIICPIFDSHNYQLFVLSIKL